MSLEQIHKNTEHSTNSLKRIITKANDTDKTTLRAAFDNVAHAIRTRHL